MDEGQERIKLAKKGDEEALAAVLLEQYDFVYHYLLKLTMHPAMAEDLTQDTMIKAIERINQYNPEKAKISTWLIQIGTNLWIDEKRRQKRAKKFINQNQLEWQLRHQSSDDWLTVTTALETLKETHRIPVILKHYYGYGYEDIAKICNIPTGTVKSRLNIALKRLREELSNEGK